MSSSINRFVDIRVWRNPIIHVGAHNGSDLLEQPLAQMLRLGGQPHALIVSESEPARAELLPEYTILRLQVVDHLALLLVDQPAKATRRNRSGDKNGAMSPAYQRDDAASPRRRQTPPVSSRSGFRTVR